MTKRIKMIVNKPHTKRSTFCTLIAVSVILVGCTFGSSADAKNQNDLGNNINDNVLNDAKEENNDNLNNKEDDDNNIQDENISSGMEERYKAILLGYEDFVNIDHNNQDIRLSLENIKEVVSDEDWVTAKITKFTIIDLDGNGENEIVLWIQANEHLDYGFEILYFQDQEVYGFTLPYRGFLNLKTDGTFYYSGGMDYSGIGRLQLSERGYTIEEVSYSDSQEGKTNVEWYDLTADSVELAFENMF